MYYAFNLYIIFDGIPYYEAEFNPIVFSLLRNISSAQYFDTSKTDGTLYITFYISTTALFYSKCFIWL